VKRCAALKKVIPVVLSVLAIGALTFAGEKDIVKFQGVVMAVDLKKRTMVVNEKTCVWTPKTTILDLKGNAVTPDRLKAETWVYIEGERDQKNRRIVVQKFHVLPGRIDGKDKQRYPFLR
jgi:hypothetical protein